MATQDAKVSLDRPVSLIEIPMDDPQATDPLLAGSQTSGNASTNGGPNQKKSSSGSEINDVSSTAKTPVSRVRHLLSDAGDGSSSDGEGVELGEDILEAHALFCQLDVLCHFNDGEMGWKEMARWLKYEEKVESGDRWSKPHVATTSLHELFEIRRGIAEGTTITNLNLNASHGCTSQVAELLCELIKEKKGLPEDQLQKILEVITKPHKHQHRKAEKKAKDEPDEEDVVIIDETTLEDRDENVDTNKNDVAPDKAKKKKKKKKWVKKDDLEEVSALFHRYPGGITPNDLLPHKPNKKLMKKIPGGSEVANIMIGQVDFLDEPIVAFLRLDKGNILGDLSEVALPTRFVVLVLGPPNTTSIWEYEEFGRAFAALFGDKVFCEVAYKAKNAQDLVDGIDEFIDDLTVLPPSIWDPSTRLPPPSQILTKDKLRKRLIGDNRHAGGPEDFHFSESADGDSTLKRTGRLCGGLIQDMKRRYGQYASDIKDAFHIQSLACVVFLYFACVTPIVTFGGLMGTATDGYLGTMESILSGAICGTTFALFGGQPLIIMGATGPMLIFESIMYGFCKEQGIDFLSFRFWTGVWITAILVIMVIWDLSFLVAYITRFTEESFSVLISLIFIMEALKKLYHVTHTRPIHTDVIRQDPSYTCHCVHPNGTNVTTDSVHVDTVLAAAAGAVETPVHDAPQNDTLQRQVYHFYNWTAELNEDCITYHKRIEVSRHCVSEDVCQERGWALDGPACHDHSITESIPDVFLFCCFLFLGTFVIAMFFRSFRGSKFFNALFRTTVADFAVFMSIMIWTGIDYSMGLDTPKLRVPDEFKTTVDGRGWIVNPMNILPAWYLIILALLPALLASILIFLDQQITAVITNRKEHKMQKGPGYHLDLMILAILVFVCSLMGLPWFVAATVRTITHVRSLFRESALKAPGERQQIVGVREQRVTGFFIHILIGVSVLMTGLLKHVPMTVLYGVFLYMGITSLGGVQFVQRITILFMPQKNQPDYVFLRHVPTKKVHLFTIVQIICMICMWVVKSIKKIAILFPVLVLALCFVRKAMDYYFTQGELFWLDHILPEEERREKEDEALDAEGGEKADQIEEPKDAKEPLLRRNRRDGSGSRRLGGIDSEERLQRRSQVST